jgi:hypothetical protein
MGFSFNPDFNVDSAEVDRIFGEFIDKALADEDEDDEEYYEEEEAY